MQETTNQSMNEHYGIGSLTKNACKMRRALTTTMDQAMETSSSVCLSVWNSSSLSLMTLEVSERQAEPRRSASASTADVSGLYRLKQHGAS